MAHGIPTILSDAAAGEMTIRHMEHCLIANGEQEWIDAIEKLQTDRQLWRKIRDNAQDFVKANYSFENGIRTMSKTLQAVDIFL